MRALITLAVAFTLTGTALAAPLDYASHPVKASDPQAATTWAGNDPQAAVDGLGGSLRPGEGCPATMPFSTKSWVRKPYLSHYERTGHTDVGNAGWTAPWTPDCSETGAPTPQWPARLRLDYGAPLAVARLAVYFPRQGNQDPYLAPTAHAAAWQTVEVLRSDDDVHYESAVRIAKLPWTSPQIIEIPNPKPARYYMVSVESLIPGNDALRVYEIETYIDKDSPIATEPLLAATAGDTGAGAPPPNQQQQALVMTVTNGSAVQQSLNGTSVTLSIQGAPLSRMTEEDSGTVKREDPAKADARGPVEFKDLSVSLFPDGVPAIAPFRQQSDSIELPTTHGLATCMFAPDPLGVRMRVTTPPPVEGQARRFIYARVKVPGAKVRFIPAYMWSAEPASTAWPGHWLTTCMAAIETDRGTLALVPDSDRCRIGIDGDTLTICLFPESGADGQNEASALLLPVAGGWWDAYQAVVSKVDKFETVRQLRPAGEAALAINRWLMLDKNWSENWQALRSFPATENFYPEGEFFFIFYGAPYTVPALWQQHLLTGDVKALERARKHVQFLIDSPARIKQGPMRGGFYAQLAGSPQHFKLVDQAYNRWMTSHATGAALWTLLYHRAMLARPGASGQPDAPPDAALDGAIAEAADCLVRTQRADGGWPFAFLEKDGSVPSGEFSDSGTIWNVWALWRAGKALNNPQWTQAAERGRDWWVRAFLEKHAYVGYWEDSNYKGVIYPTHEGYETALAIQAFLEMGDTAHAAQVARDCATWVQTRTPSYREYHTSYGHVPEQFTWPGDMYVAPTVGFALGQFARASGDERERAFFAPYGTLAKGLSWWCEPDTGASFFPLEAAAYLPLTKTPLTKSYWVDWNCAQESIHTIWWLIEAINAASGGRIAIDRDLLTGTIDGEPARAWMPEGAPRLVAADRHQLNVMGYQVGDEFNSMSYLLVILNDSREPVPFKIEGGASFGFDGKLAFTSPDGKALPDGQAAPGLTLVRFAGAP